jgi:hypothetical protein
MASGRILGDPTRLVAISGDDATVQVPAGALAVGQNGTIYRYCIATVAWAGADDALRAAIAATGYGMAPTSTTAGGEQVIGAAVGAVTIAQYGWVTVYGKVAAMEAFAVTGYTAQLAICGGVTATRMGNYVSSTHTACCPSGNGLETVAAAASGAVLLRCL